MGVIIAIDREGERHELAANEGVSIMEILRDAGMAVEAICGGQCICSTCHVYVDEQWYENLPPSGAAETILLEDSGHYQATSRLSCQVEYREELDGLSLVLAPEF